MNSKNLFPSTGCLVLGITMLVFSVPMSARASSIRIDPRNFRCEDLINSGPSNQTWDQTLEVEHCDRVKRLARIARLSLPGAEPEFFVERIARGRLPGIDVDVPLVRVVFPQRVFFDTALDTLRPEATAVIQTVSDTLKLDVPDVAVFVAGHTDPRGERDYNQNLSVDRANSVAEALRDSGLKYGAIWRVGFGPDMPLVPNDGPESWGYNRRVEFLFAAKSQAVAAWLADTQVDGLCSAPSEVDTQMCKKSITLRSNYRAAEVVSKARRDAYAASVALEIAAKRAEEARATAASINTVVKTKPRKLVEVKPELGRVININPQSRTAQLVVKGEKHVGR